MLSAYRTKDGTAGMYVHLLEARDNAVVLAAIEVQRDVVWNTSRGGQERWGKAGRRRSLLVRFWTAVWSWGHCTGC